MSDFDPFRLYQKHYKKSYTGQVIRKKPTENIYAFTQRDLKQAIKIIEAYGYSLAQPIIPAQVSIYGGTIISDSISYGNLIDNNLKNHLLIYNSHIFDQIYENFKLFININSVELVHTPQAGYTRTIEFNLIDGTSAEYVINQTQSFILEPYSSSQIRYYHATGNGQVNRGSSESYNNGLIYELIYDRSVYESLLNNDYSEIPDVVLGTLTSDQQHNTYWQYTATIILN